MRANRGCLSTPTAVQTLPEPQEEPPREGPARPEAGALCSAPTLELGTPQEQLQRGFQCKCSGHALQAPSPPAPQPPSPPALQPPSPPALQPPSPPAPPAV
ncbi:unnamed protein product [Arctogadus glacialis]